MMRFYSETLGLSPGAFSLLRDLIHERTGLYYGDEKRDLLADKLSPLVVETGFENFLDYYYLLKYDADAALHWDRVINALSVQETYFWREVDQIHALVNVLVPAYAERHPNRPIRIWSAACATGEEPLTIAMALQEAGWFNRAEIEIHASDASSQALIKARKGVYRERSFRNLSQPLKERYFREAEAGYQIASTLHQRVQWHKANLISPEDIHALCQSPFIFCRNVFIYFSEKGIRKVVDCFYENMPNPAYLFTGASESLLKLGTSFELEEVGGAFVYVK